MKINFIIIASLLCSCSPESEQEQELQKKTQSLSQIIGEGPYEVYAYEDYFYDKDFSHWDGPSPALTQKNKRNPNCILRESPWKIMERAQTIQPPRPLSGNISHLAYIKSKNKEVFFDVGEIYSEGKYYRMEKDPIVRIIDACISEGNENVWTNTKW